ncbi:hypothetical protein NL676_000450 [Syzygium grande]|nr:hypothetical protein NL676_000450 [Syzygium grande]
MKCGRNSREMRGVNLRERLGWTFLNGLPAYPRPPRVAPPRRRRGGNRARSTGPVERRRDGRWALESLGKLRPKSLHLIGLFRGGAVAHRTGLSPLAPRARSSRSPLGLPSLALAADAVVTQGSPLFFARKEEKEVRKVYFCVSSGGEAVLLAFAHRNWLGTGPPGNRCRTVERLKLKPVLKQLG